MGFQAWRIWRRVSGDPARGRYIDLAITPPGEDELETLAMFSETAGGTAAVAKKHTEDLARARLAAKANQAAE
jgi:hypothetical protein